MPKDFASVAYAYSNDRHNSMLGGGLLLTRRSIPSKGAPHDFALAIFPLNARVLLRQQPFADHIGKRNFECDGREEHSAHPSRRLVSMCSGALLEALKCSIDLDN
jgi:hypothetical protein